MNCDTRACHRSGVPLAGTISVRGFGWPPRRSTALRSMKSSVQSSLKPITASGTPSESHGCPSSGVNPISTRNTS